MFLTILASRKKQRMAIEPGDDDRITTGREEIEKDRHETARLIWYVRNQRMFILMYVCMYVSINISAFPHPQCWGKASVRNIS